MTECAICTRDGIVTVTGKAILSGEVEEVGTDLCVDHYNMIKSGGKKWCPSCTVSDPVKMEFDSVVGHQEYWYCPKCNTEFRYDRTDM